MRIIVIIIVLFFQLPVFAQDGHLMNDQTDSTQTIISYNRRLLIDHFRAGRLDSVSLLLDNLDHRKMPILNPEERLLLYYWIERYNAIDSLAQNFDKISKKNASDTISGQIVWNVLSVSSVERIDMLVQWIDQSGCSDNDFNFRVQLLELMLNSTWEDRNSFHREIISFVNQYNFVDETLMVDIMQDDEYWPMPDPDDMPWNAKLTLGMGPTFLSGNITDYLSTRMCLSFSFDVNYRQWYFSFLMQAVFAKLLRDIPVGAGIDVWEAGSSANITNLGLSIGYSVFNSKYINITPSIGLSFNESSPSEQQMDNNEILRDAGIRWGVAGIYGLNTDLKIYNMIDILKQKDLLFSLNFKLNYIPGMFNTVGKKYSGNLFFASFGISMNITSW